MGESRSNTVSLRAASGANATEVLRVATIAAANASVEVSQAAPFADPVHQALCRIGAGVRIESTERWSLAAALRDRVVVVGPRRAREATWRYFSELGNASPNE